MDRDSNVLFGVLANRLHPSQWSVVKRALGQWQDDPSVELPERLVAAGVVSERERQGVEEMVRSLVEDHNGDAGAALAALGGAAGLQTAPAAGVLEGQTLAGALNAAKSAEDRLAMLPHVIALCDILGVAHGRGIVHRALTPEGVLLTPYGETLVTDWSLSKMRGHPDHHKERLAKLAGDDEMKPYLSPEFLQGGPDEVDTRSDVYALGAILYLLLMGKPPEDRKPPKGSGPLYQVCRRAMFEEASARYATASALAEALEHAVEGAEVKEPAAAQHAGGASALYRTLFGLTAALLLAFGVASAFLYRALVAEQLRAANVYADAQENRTSAEEERDRLASELEAARQIRERIEAERDVALQDSLSFRAQAEELRQQLAAAADEEAAPPAPAPAPAPAPQPRPEPPARPQPAPAEQQSPQTNTPAERVVVEPFSTPLPDIMAPPEESAQPEPEQAQPEQPAAPGQAPTPPQQAPPTPQQQPGAEPKSLRAALPDLSAALVDQAAAGTDSVAMVRVLPSTPQEVREMGFRDGDVIMRINRTPIQNSGQAKEALAAVQDDAGFSVRIMRQGRAEWIRVNFESPAPAAPAAPVAPQQPPVAPQQPAAPSPAP